MKDFTLTKITLKLSSLHKSFTHWFNVTGYIALEVIVNNPEVKTYLTTQGLIAIIVIGNIFLRVFKTTKAIESK